MERARRWYIVVLRIEDGPAGLVINPDISRGWSLLLPRASVILSPAIEPIVIIITARMLLDQSLLLLFSSSSTGLHERGHVINTSVIELETTSNTSHTLLINKKIAEEGLARLN